jgi:hypothetical protein
MTPIVLISFLISLAWVDYRYTLMRSHTHSEDDPSRLPNWLHTLLYRPQPQHYVRVKTEGEGVVEDENGNRFYYHSNQKKLLRMEAEDAFQMRWVVVTLLGSIMAGVVWGAWLLISWGWHKWRLTND